jgi:hypothetical protein
MKKLMILAAIVLLAVATPSFAGPPHSHSASGGGSTVSGVAGQAQAYTTITPAATGNITTGIPVQVSVTGSDMSAGAYSWASGKGAGTVATANQTFSGNQTQTTNSTLGGPTDVSSNATQTQNGAYTATTSVTSTTLNP